MSYNMYNIYCILTIIYYIQIYYICTLQAEKRDIAKKTHEYRELQHELDILRQDTYNYEKQKEYIDNAILINGGNKLNYKDYKKLMILLGYERREGGHNSDEEDENDDIFQGHQNSDPSRNSNKMITNWNDIEIQNDIMNKLEQDILLICKDMNIDYDLLLTKLDQNLILQ